MNAAVQSGIEVGRRVRYHLPYGDTPEGVIVAVHGEPTGRRASGVCTFLRDDDCRFDIITFDGRQFDSRETSIDRPGIGSVNLLDRVHGDGMIESLRRRVIERKAREATEAAIAKQKEADALAAIKVENPHLLPASEKNAAAKNLRAELKRAGIKAKSVRQDHGSVRVLLAIDATDADFEAAKRIGNRFEFGYFDGMDDCYHYTRSAWTEAFGGWRFVFVERDWRGGAK